MENGENRNKTSIISFISGVLGTIGIGAIYKGLFGVEILPITLILGITMIISGFLLKYFQKDIENKYPDFIDAVETVAGMFVKEIAEDAAKEAVEKAMRADAEKKLSLVRG